MRRSVDTGDDRRRVTLWGRNIFDEYYDNNVFRRADSVWALHRDAGDTWHKRRLPPLKH